MIPRRHHACPAAGVGHQKQGYRIAGTVVYLSRGPITYLDRGGGEESSVVVVVVVVGVRGGEWIPT